VNFEHVLLKIREIWKKLFPKEKFEKNGKKWKKSSMGKKFEINYV
jgi:hypothetical protein